MHRITSWICDKCGRSFNTQTECRTHEKTHTITSREFEGILEYKQIDHYGEVQYIGNLLFEDVLNYLQGRKIKITIID